MLGTEIHEEKYLDIINQFAIGLLNQSTINDILWSVIDNVLSKLDFYDCAIYLLDENKEDLVRVAFAYNGEVPKTNTVVMIKVGRGIVGQAALSKQAKITDDTSRCEHYIPEGQWQFSEITVPILHENELIGIIDCEHPEKNYYQPVHLSILTTVASMVAIKIIQARQFEDLVERDRKFDLIYNSTNDLIFLLSVEPDHVYRYISVNRAYLQLTKTSREEILGKTPSELWSVDIATAIENCYKRAIREKKTVTHELRIKPDSKEVLIEIDITPVFDSDGKCVNLSGIARDITTAEVARKELVQEREKYQMLFSKANDAIFILKNDVIVECNDSTLYVFGRSREEIIGFRPHELSPKFQPDGKSSNRRMNSGNFQWIYTKKDRSFFMAEVTLSKFYFNGKKYSQAIVRDISERIKAEEQLKQSKEGFENLFESSPNAIFIHDTKRITNVNRAFLEQFGYNKKADIIGSDPLKTVVYPEDASKALEARKKGQQRDDTHIPNIRLIRNDGSVFDAETFLSSLFIDDVQHFQVIAHDITERKRSDEVLRASEKRYRDIFENSLDGIYKSTPEGKFVEVSPALVRMLGYDSTEDLLAIDIISELYFNKEDRKNVSDQYRLRKKDGSDIWVEDHGFYQYNDQGEVVYHHGILRDVTLRNQKNQEMRELLAMTSDQNKRLQNFAHIVSHNIRSHSANLTSLVSFMGTSSTDEERGKIFQMLKSSTEQLEETITNLNEIVTVHQNLNKPVEKRGLMVEVEKTLQILSAEIKKHDVNISLHIPVEIEVNVIPAYLDSILLNLTSNAIKYRKPNTQLKLKFMASVVKRGFVKFSIADNGRGIDLDAHKDKVFGMYKTFHENEDARGFGLYITKNQIEAMKGRIEVESIVDQGTTFTIYFNEKD